MQLEKLSQTHEIGYVSMYNQIKTSNFKIRQRKLVSRISNKNFVPISLKRKKKKKQKTQTPKNCYSEYVYILLLLLS